MAADRFHWAEKGPLTPLVLLFSLVFLARPPVAEGATESQPAQASKEDLAQAKRHYENGAAYYNAGNYGAARGEFQDAYRLSHMPDLLFNLAYVAKKMNQPEEELRYLERYLEERPQAPDRAKVQNEIDQLKQLQARQHEVEQRQAEQRQAEQRQAEQRQAEQQAAAPPPARPRSKLPPVPALGLMGGGAAFLIIGIGLGGAAITTAHQVESGPTFDRNLDQKGRAENSAAIAFDVIGAAALSAGAAWTGYWFFRGRHEKDNPAQPGATPVRATLVPSGLGLSLIGGF